jgi:hypothetical protein
MTATFVGLDVERAHFRREPQSTLLRDDEQLAVGVVEVAVSHRRGSGENVDSASLVACHRDDAVDEIDG